MTDSYIFMECCGCGRTRLFLEIDQPQFVIYYMSDWMGSMGSLWIQMEGLFENETTGTLTSVRYSIQQKWIQNLSKELLIGDIYEIQPDLIKVILTKYNERQMSDNLNEPEPDGERHLGDGSINMGNCPNYNAYCNLSMKFMISGQFDDHVKFNLCSRDYQDESGQESEKLQIESINSMLHPDKQFLSKFINFLVEDINYVQMGQLEGDQYREIDQEGSVCMSFKKSYLDVHERPSSIKSEINFAKQIHIS